MQRRETGARHRRERCPAAIAERLASDGLFVYAHANRNRVEALVECIRQDHGDDWAPAVTFDLTAADETASALTGLHGAARSLARELGSRGVTVDVVAPA